MKRYVYKLMYLSPARMNAGDIEEQEQKGWEVCGPIVKSAESDNWGGALSITVPLRKRLPRKKFTPA